MSRQFDFERFFELFRGTYEETCRLAARTIDHSLVVRDWLCGWHIVGFEGSASSHRVSCGEELISRLSSRIRANGIKGCSPNNLGK